MDPKQKSTKKRIDVLLVERNLAPSRERAQGLILSGNVLVDDVPVTKAGQAVSVLSAIRVRGQDHPYVSRGGIKLQAALDAFSVKTDHRIALDIGASTGGFTQVLLLSGVAKVIAVDVGHSQMDWKIRSDSRVVVKERINARYLEFDQIGEQVDVIVVDVSFISLEKILPALIPFSKPETDWITLVKPQFEVGKGDVGKNGVVTSDNARNQALAKIIEFGKTLSLISCGSIESPITGTEGNREFLVHWKVLNQHTA